MTNAILVNYNQFLGTWSTTTDVGWCPDPPLGTKVSRYLPMDRGITYQFNIPEGFYPISFLVVKIYM